MLHVPVCYTLYECICIHLWTRTLVHMYMHNGVFYSGVIEDAIESANLPCDVGTYSEDLCENVTVSSFDVGETFSDVSCCQHTGLLLEQGRGGQLPLP